MDATRAPRAEMTLFGEYIAPTADEIRAAVDRAHLERSETVLRHIQAAIGFVADHVGGFFESLRLAIAREQTYRRLVMMDDRALARLGISRDQIADYVLGNASLVPVRPVPAVRGNASPVLETAVQSPSAPMPARPSRHREAA